MGVKEEIDAVFQQSKLHWPEFFAVNSGTDQHTGEKVVIVMLKCKDCGEHHSFVLSQNGADEMAKALFVNMQTEGVKQ